MKFGSVCSGIEAASVAWHPLGWKAAWLSEIEPFPSAVLKHHYPDVPNLGDMTLLPERILSGEVEAPDLFCGGTPCQAFSVAGLRKSLDDARGNLSLTFCEIANAIDEMRSVQQSNPCIVFWENVPGVLNTKDNAFGCFLGALAGEDDALVPSGGRWTNAGFIDGPQRAVAWRVLDAQYFGVAQRRRRVFVVASARADFDPAAVLFEFDGVRRDTAPSREKGQAIAPTVTNGAPFSRTGNARVEAQAIIAPALAQCLTTGTGQRYDPETETILPVSTFSCGGIGAYTEDQTSATLLKSGQDLGNGCEALTVHPVMQPAYAIQGNMIGRADTAGPQGSGISEDVSFTLTKADQHAVAQPIPINSMNALRDADAAASTGCGIGQAGEAMYTLTKGHSHAVAQPIGCFKGGQGSAAGGIGYDEHISPTLGAADSGSNRTPALMQGMQVRRLTPVECERLQGFPDNYTDIKAKGKPTPDGPRYKALGNSWAVPVVRWIGERIARAT